MTYADVIAEPIMRRDMLLSPPAAAIAAAMLMHSAIAALLRDSRLRRADDADMIC